MSGSRMHRTYQVNLVQFFKFRDGYDGYHLKDVENITQEELRTITPVDIARFLRFKAYGDPDHITSSSKEEVEADNNNNKLLVNVVTIQHIIFSISRHFPETDRKLPWDSNTKTGNPCKSREVAETWDAIRSEGGSSSTVAAATVAKAKQSSESVHSKLRMAIFMRYREMCLGSNSDNPVPMSREQHVSLFLKLRDMQQTHRMTKEVDKIPTDTLLSITPEEIARFLFLMAYGGMNVQPNDGGDDAEVNHATKNNNNKLLMAFETVRKYCYSISHFIPKKYRNIPWDTGAKRGNPCKSRIVKDTLRMIELNQAANDRELKSDDDESDSSDGPKDSAKDHGYKKAKTVGQLERTESTDEEEDEDSLDEEDEEIAIEDSRRKSSQIPPPSQFVPWSQLYENHYGQTNLWDNDMFDPYRRLNDGFQLDSLVGWATHIDRATFSRTKPTALEHVKMGSNNKTTITNISEEKNLNSEDEAAATSQSGEAATPISMPKTVPLPTIKTNEYDHNPLLGVSNGDSSLPPSLLRFLQETMVDTIESSSSSEHSKTTRNDKKRARSINSNDDEQHRVSSSRNDEDADELYESFHVSALVALGMMAEEMITALLLPLAQQHVKRCQTLDQQGTSEKIHSSEWILPPEEALEKLVSEEELVTKKKKTKPKDTMYAPPSTVRIEDSFSYIPSVVRDGLVTFGPATRILDDTR